MHKFVLNLLSNKDDRYSAQQIYHASCLPANLPNDKPRATSLQQMCAVFYCLSITVLPLEIKLPRGERRDPINQYNLPHFCACLKPGPRFPMRYETLELFKYLLTWLIHVYVYKNAYMQRLSMEVKSTAGQGTFHTHFRV